MSEEKTTKEEEASNIDDIILCFSNLRFSQTESPQQSDITTLLASLNIQDAEDQPAVSQNTGQSTLNSKQKPHESKDIAKEEQKTQKIKDTGLEYKQNEKSSNAFTTPLKKSDILQSLKSYPEQQPIPRQKSPFYLSLMTQIQKKINLKQPLKLSQKSNTELAKFIRRNIIDTVIKTIALHMKNNDVKIKFKLIKDGIRALRIGVCILKTMVSQLSKIILVKYPIISKLISKIMAITSTKQNIRNQFLPFNRILITDFLCIIVTKIQLSPQSKSYESSDLWIASYLLKFIRYQFCYHQHQQAYEGQNAAQFKLQKLLGYKNNQVFVASILFTICFMCQNNVQFCQKFLNNKSTSRMFAIQLTRQQSAFPSKLLFNLLKNIKTSVSKYFYDSILDQILRLNPDLVEQLIKHLNYTRKGRKCITLEIIKQIKNRCVYGVEIFLSNILSELQTKRKDNSTYLWLIQNLIQKEYIDGNVLLRMAAKFHLDYSTMQSLRWFKHIDEQFQIHEQQEKKTQKNKQQNDQSPEVSSQSNEKIQSNIKLNVNIADQLENLKVKTTKQQENSEIQQMIKKKKAEDEQKQIQMNIKREKMQAKVCLSLQNSFAKYQQRQKIIDQLIKTNKNQQKEITESSDQSK